MHYYAFLQSPASDFITQPITAPVEDIFRTSELRQRRTWLIKQCQLSRWMSASPVSQPALRETGWGGAAGWVHVFMVWRLLVYIGTWIMCVSAVFAHAFIMALILCPGKLTGQPCFVYAVAEAVTGNASHHCCSSSQDSASPYFMCSYNITSRPINLHAHPHAHTGWRTAHISYAFIYFTLILYAPNSLDCEVRY